MRIISLSLLLSVLYGCSHAPTPPSITLSSTLSDRISILQPKPQDFFYAPRNEEEDSLYKTGLFHHWQYYGKSAAPVKEEFSGYILLSDPYHRGLKKISFLLGSDCSNFVHRFYQMIGAEFRFMKTRHWIHLAKAKMSGNEIQYYRKQNASGTPIDLKICEWDKLLTQFTLVRDAKLIQLGDIIVYPKAEGILGQKGHMGFISKTHPVRVLQSKYKVGIIETDLENSEYYILRWKDPIKEISTTGIADLLNQEYPESPVESCQ